MRPALVGSAKSLYLLPKISTESARGTAVRRVSYDFDDFALFGGAIGDLEAGVVIRVCTNVSTATSIHLEGYRDESAAPGQLQTTTNPPSAAKGMKGVVKERSSKTGNAAGCGFLDNAFKLRR